PRQHLAFLLWPDSIEAQARTNLRHLLHLLRRALPEADRFLDVTQRTLQWRCDQPCWLDVAAFEQALAKAEREADENALVTLRDAVRLYRGDLLEASYDDWLSADRDRLRRGSLDVHRRLVGLLDARGEQAEAIEFAERLIAGDPLEEPAYR